MECLIGHGEVDVEELVAICVYAHACVQKGVCSCASKVCTCVRMRICAVHEKENPDLTSRRGGRDGCMHACMDGWMETGRKERRRGGAGWDRAGPGRDGTGRAGQPKA